MNHGRISRLESLAQDVESFGSSQTLDAEILVELPQAAATSRRITRSLDSIWSLLPANWQVHSIAQSEDLVHRQAGESLEAEAAAVRTVLVWPLGGGIVSGRAPTLHASLLAAILRAHAVAKK